MVISDRHPWDDVYKLHGIIDLEPSQHIVELVPEFKRAGVGRVLDHGCGPGRHAVYLAEQGFYVVATDISQEAIQYAREWVECFDLREKVELVREDMSCIPYPDRFFDAVISNRVISHATRKQRENTIAEIERVLNPGGYLFLATISASDNGYGKGEKIEGEEGTFIKIDGFRGGKSPHHFYTYEELTDDFKSFVIERLDEHGYPPSKNLPSGLREWVMLAKKI